MSHDLSPWRMLAGHPQEESAFRAWAAGLEAQGRTVVPLGFPDVQPRRYAERFGLEAEVLTVDAHVSVDGQEFYVDHTTLRAPGGNNLPAAIRAAHDELNRELAGAALLSPTGGLRVTVTPHTGSKKDRRRYFDRLVAFGHRAAITGRPVYDPDAPDFNPDLPYPVAEPWQPPGPDERVELTIALAPADALRWPVLPTPWGWRHDATHVRGFVGAPIVEKINEAKQNGRPGQLRRARQLGLNTALLIDGRLGWEPPRPVTPGQPPRKPPPPIFDLPAPLVREVLTRLTATHPDALHRAWLLSTDGQVHDVYNEPAPSLPDIPPPCTTALARERELP
ncbi:hypothetical protein [Streptomyces sp. NPDC001750]|uniref:hypothetical protein n=1 Tax=Streptomyces sp. NPDC001750 TaxID=3364607 RepID=UPI0036CB4980